MLRPAFGRTCLTPIVTSIAALAAMAASSRGEQTFQPQSTLDARVAPHNLSLDATIESMVRRGLLADLSAQPQRPAPPLRPPVTPQRRSVPPVVIPPLSDQPAAAPSRAADTRSGWRPAGSGSSAAAAPSRQQQHMSSPQRRMAQRPHTNYRQHAHRGTNLPSSPSTAPSRAPQQQPAAAAEQPQTLVIVPPARPIETAPTGAPHDEAAAPSDEDLAPIDSLPETPAPDHDAPGDPREPEQELEAGASGAGDADSMLPDRSSVAGIQLTPIGEPDRIVRDNENAAPPEEPENYQESEEVQPTPPTTAPKRPPLTRNQIMLREKMRRVLKYYYARPLHTGNRSPWEVMHQMLAFEVYSRIRQGGPTGEPVTAVGWLCFNRPCKGRTLMYLNEDGDIRVKVGPALQGHHGQLLALLAQARVRSDYPMHIDGKEFTVADLIEMEKRTCYPRTELTFKLIGLQRYLDLDARWVNDQGMAWDFPTLLREEMQQPVRTAACGGTHRLSGLILTAKKYQRSGKPLTGAYADAARFVANYQNYAYRLQNPDGSFSTEWFKGPGAEEDIDRRLKTTGHTLEFLIYAANDQQLTYYRTVKAVNYLANIMWANRDRDWEAGPLGHAIHALVLYDRLVFVPHDEAAPGGPVAQKPSHVLK